MSRFGIFKWPYGIFYNKSSYIAVSFVDLAMVPIMYERRSKVRGSKICEVEGCNKEKQHSVARSALDDSLPGMKIESRGKTVQLCKEHYKEYKNATKDDRELSWLRRTGS